VSAYITKNFPSFQVQGNVIPEYLIPVNGHNNQYYDIRTKKCVNFPSIGAFEVVFRNKLLFSKKSTNTWPDFD
jgi:hypothetical protein